MNITQISVAVGELTAGYVDNEEQGVRGYDGKLNIRPPYQREFIYKDKQREDVLQTVLKGFPLNVMYWSKNEDGSYEVIDGQQRTISLCQYVTNQFSIKVNNYEMQFYNLTDELRNKILDYELMIYVCEGTDQERLDWFQIINIAGEKLADQELRNAVYSGPWVSDAKRYFSKNGCVAYKLASDYMAGSPIRQDYLEAVLSWNPEGEDIDKYMGRHQQDMEASDLWIYFQSVIAWVKAKFPKYRKEMKGLPWGLYYNAWKDSKLDANDLEQEIAQLMMDDDVTNKKGIYRYVLEHNEKYLNIRAFTESQKRAAYEKQGGICPLCGNHFEYEKMEGDHITPWHEGGKTEPANLQMLCKNCNRTKSGK